MLFALGMQRHLGTSIMYVYINNFYKMHIKNKVKLGFFYDYKVP